MRILRRLPEVIFVLSLIVLPLAGANAQDIRVENYKKTVDGLVARWAAAEIQLAQQLSPILTELDTLGKKPAASLTDAEKARIADLQKQRNGIRAKMENESANLRLELLIVQVQPGVPERELVQLPGWLKGIIKAKGVPLGRGVTLVPDADFDVKALKLKSFSAGLRFDW